MYIIKLRLRWFKYIYENNDMFKKKHVHFKLKSKKKKKPSVHNKIII